MDRDIKSTNVLIDDDFRAKLCDFSFACHDESTSKLEYVYGTSEFMSPEIAMGEDFSLPTDIFSFGILLCELITGLEPSESFMARHARTFFAVSEQEVIDAILPECPEELQVGRLIW